VRPAPRRRPASHFSASARIGSHCEPARSSFLPLPGGPINGEVFLAWVKESLAPTLKPGEIVIMDNLGSHRGKAVRQAIRRAGAKLIFLPKYSPDLNPIEQVFSKLKHLLRKAQARTYDAILAAIGEVLGTFTPTAPRQQTSKLGAVRPLAGHTNIESTRFRC
jgi:transposase